MNLSVFYLKRCVALPGDTLSIESGIYKVKNFQDSLGYLFLQQKLSQKSQDNFSSDIWNCFPFDSLHFQWNIKDFGPLFVPFSGATLVLDTLNLHLYKNIIEYETDKPLFLSKGSIYSGDKEIDAYTFKLNYYFMAGDNIFDSKDSRYWGLLPEDCIIGKAFLVWRSTDMQNGKIRLDRFFKVIK